MISAAIKSLTLTPKSANAVTGTTELNIRKRKTCDAAIKVLNTEYMIREESFV